MRVTSTNVDSFEPQGPGILQSFARILLALTLSRCWHLILLFSAWAAGVCLISAKVHDLSIPPTLITVFGTVLGFVISYRTSSSFERYNEGRKYWSSIVLSSRVLARMIWFHVPHIEGPPEKMEQILTQTLIEKKSAINLIEAFSVALKHYLRGEETIYYEDLHPLVRFLPAYLLPAGRPTTFRSDAVEADEDALSSPQSSAVTFSEGAGPALDILPPAPAKPSGASPESPTQDKISQRKKKGTVPLPLQTDVPTSPQEAHNAIARGSSIQILDRDLDLEKGTRASARRDTFRGTPPATGQTYKSFGGTLHRATTLLPAYDPPRYALFDVFPFSLFVGLLVKRGKAVKGRKFARLKARAGNVNHNIPLEITFYLSAYIVELQRRKILDVPTLSTSMNNVHLLVDSLTGLERILTTPIPFSYSIQLWAVTALYVGLLPFQIWASFHWLTIPITAITAFVFFGFLVAGEEIENPFGYDLNDLGLDYICHHVIRGELQALTSRPPPTLDDWALHPDNTNILAGNGEYAVTPQEWMKRGEQAMLNVLGKANAEAAAAASLPPTPGKSSARNIRA